MPGGQGRGRQVVWTVDISRVWNGLDQSAGFIIQSSPGGFGLDWIRNSPTQRILDWTGFQKCAMCIPYLDLRQFLLIVTLTSEVLPSNLQLFTSSFVFTCRLFYKAFGRYLLCCARIGLDWIQILVHQLDWTGLGSVTRGFELDWIVSTRSIPYSGHIRHRGGRYRRRRLAWTEGAGWLRQRARAQAEELPSRCHRYWPGETSGKICSVLMHNAVGASIFFFFGGGGGSPVAPAGSASATPVGGRISEVPAGRGITLCFAPVRQGVPWLGSFRHRSSFILRITYPQSSVTPPLAGPSGRRPPGM